MMLQQFQNTITSLEEKMSTPQGVTPRRKFALEFARLGQRLYDGRTPVAWGGIAAPFDVLNAMGFTSCFIEFVGSSLAASGMVEMFLDRAEQDGLVPDICAYHRAVEGAASLGLMPVPEVFIATTCPCTAGQTTMESLASTMRRELVVLHVPLEESTEAVKYLVDQLESMITTITKVTGRQLDPTKLAHAIELSNQAASLMNEVYALASKVPSPTSSRELKDFGIALPLLFGRPESIEIARTYRDAFKQRINERDTTKKDDKEGVRLLWVQNRIQFREPLVKWLEEEMGVVVVVDELNNVTWAPIDPNNPLEGIARRMISNSFNGPIDRRIERLHELSCRYRVQGAINPCHWGCRQGAGARGLIQKGLADAGVPVLNLEVDCVDPRSFSEGQLRTRLEAFIEMLEAKPSSGG